jgi:hypothetical protein
MREGLIVLNLVTGGYFHLAGSGAAIWRLIERHGRLDRILEHAATEHGSSAPLLEPDVHEFIQAAIAQGLLEVAESSRSVEVGGAGGPPFKVGRSAVAVHADVGALGAEFDRQHYVLLPQFIEPSLLAILERSVQQGAFVDRTHKGIGTELCLVPGIATSALQLLFNDPALLEVVTRIADGDPVRCFDGRVYRMAAGAGHHDSWHSDAGEDRCVGMSVNLSPEGYDGGVLEIRNASSAETNWTVPNVGFGSAVMFRISPALRHRVGTIRGARARTAYAGWFRSSPDFQDLFFRSLPTAESA